MRRTKAWRRHQDQRVINKRLKQAKEIDPHLFADRYEGQEHRLAKKAPFTCGNSKCKVCHPEKNYQDGNHKDYEYYKRHPEELDGSLLEPDEWCDYDFGLDDEEAA